MCKLVHALRRAHLLQLLPLRLGLLHQPLDLDATVTHTNINSDSTAQAAASCLFLTFSSRSS